MDLKWKRLWLEQGCGFLGAGGGRGGLVNDGRMKARAQSCIAFNSQMKMSLRYINLKFREGFWAENMNLEVSVYT